MCESRVYLLRGGKKEKIMDAAVLVKDEDGRVLVVGLLGERKELKKVRISEISVDHHEVLLVREEEI
ncbi:MAG: CooT family nickel-binding protein [Candidatus Hydrothermarchaeota archaeon]|nr:CooT family nickel-binding protein [Candidatus Hydrothermarchaeota archaeon]